MGKDPAPVRSRLAWALLLLASSTLALAAAQAARGQVKQYPSRLSRDREAAAWNKAIVDTTSGADYLTDAEKRVIIEINMVRTNPAEYARSILMPLRFYYHGSLLEYPRETPILTKEGILALEECISALLVAKPGTPLVPKKGLSLAARDHVRDQGPTGATGHTGSDGSGPHTRIDRFGHWSKTAGEDIDYGNTDPRRIVTSLLVDDGVPDRGHRKVLFEKSFRFAGVAIGPHKVFGHMCVIDFAAAYQDESPAGRSPSIRYDQEPSSRAPRRPTCRP